MFKAISLREEDYWLIPVSFLAIVFITICLYAGAMQIRLTAGLLGFAGLFFTTYIVRRGYNKRRANVHMLFCLVLAVLLALAAYLLTN